MAKILNKDPITYERERDSFIQELKHFHDTRGTPFRRVPKINGHEVDLYLLYVLVTAHGGWVKVNARNEWDPLVEQFSLPKQCVNSGVALKQIYLRYLDRYEKVHYLGEDADRGSDDDEESRHKRWSARALHSVPLTYNYHQHNVAEGLRSYNGLSTDLYKSSDYDRLALSLISPLPNEQDFAINVCMLLSNEGKHTLRLDKCPRLSDLLLAHAGVFNHESMRELFNDVYTHVRHHSMHQFWKDTLREDIIELTDERKFPTKRTKKDMIVHNDNNQPPTKSTVKHRKIEERLETMEVNVVNSELSCEVTKAASSSLSSQNDADDLFAEAESGLLNESRPRLKIEASDYELFCVGRSFGTQDYFGQRVLQIATILRNLSFSEENVSILAKNVTFLRFLVLCSGSRWNTLHQLGLDMLGNVAMEVLVEDPNSSRLSACLISTVSHGIISQDRSVVVSCLEVLNKLSQKDENEDVMLRCVEQQVYDRVCQFLTLHDIMLLIQTLECLYSLSSLGERACNCIARVHGCIDTLVALITVEAQSYGPKACILMRVVETAPAGTTLVNSTSSMPPTTTGTIATIPSSPAPNATIAPIIKHTGTSPTPIKPHHVSTIMPPTKHINPVPSQTVIGAPQPAVATPVAVTQQHAQQQVAQENEQFALSWLRASCELSAGGKIEQGELYRQYLAACSRIGRRGVIAPLHFPRCVRSVFGGSVGPNMHKSNIVGGENTSYYEGIKVRAQAIPRSPLAASTVTPVTLDTSLPLSTTQPSSPILKAQLSAPPKPAAKPGPEKVVSHPHLTQALLGGGDGVKEGGSPSSLIKSLLASKVNTQPSADVSMSSMTPVQCASPTNVTNMQVTQRQQRLLQQQQQQVKKDPVPITSTPNAVAKKTPCKPVDIKPKLSRINGAKVEVTSKEVMLDNGPVPSQGNGRGVSVSAPLPPLAPLSTGPHQRLELEDSNSTNNSLASSSGVRINHTSTDDGENSLTSFEGILLNGIPPTLDVDATSNESSGKDCTLKLASKSLMLADLLEKKVDRKDHPLLNGVLGKELRIGDKGLELVENHLEKMLKETVSCQTKDVQISKNNDVCDNTRSVIQSTNAVNNNQCIEPIKVEMKVDLEEVIQEDTRNSLKRPAEEDPEAGDAKRQHLETNGSVDDCDASASAAAANLYAALAASTLEDEQDLEIPSQQLVVQDNNPMRQVYLSGDANQQQLIVTSAPRQIIMSQPQSQVLITPSGQITLHAAGASKSVSQIVQASGVAPRTQMVQGQVMLTQGSSGQFILSQAPQNSVQIGNTHYVVAQQQTALVQGQTQTVLVAQTQQQQGTAAKTIIILQPQGGNNAPHQKVMVTQQGQPVVVTQVPRPILQTPASSIPPALVPTTAKPTSLSPRPITPTPAPTPTVPKPPITTTPILTPVSKSSVIKAATRPVSSGVIQSVHGNPALRVPVPAETADKTNGTAIRPYPPGKNGTPSQPQPSMPSINPAVNHAASQVTTPTIPPSSGPKTPVIDPSAFLCEWRGCMRSFKSANEVYMHACEAHCPSGSQEIQCLWERCDAMKRKRFSLMTHLYDRHCNADVLRMMAVRRKQLSVSGRSEIPPPQPPPPHPGYAPNAAFHAIKRHALEFVNPKELMDDNEGPVTKSIRLTSSLILRNLVIYSTNGRRTLRSYEPHLASIALSNVESSRTIAQVLYDMNQQSSNR